jgi:hypothetical protein
MKVPTSFNNGLSPILVQAVKMDSVYTNRQKPGYDI